MILLKSSLLIIEHELANFSEDKKENSSLADRKTATFSPRNNGFAQKLDVKPTVTSLSFSVTNISKMRVFFVCDRILFQAEF